MKSKVRRGNKILLVEDDPHVRNAVKMIMEFDSHEVVTAEHGGAALKLLEQARFDLVITDYWMPGMNGDELAASIKQRWPDLPIILMSGSLANANDFEPAIAGVDCLLNKPFSFDELREAANWALERYAKRRRAGLEHPDLPGGQPDQTTDLSPL
jgi:DNA-binding response OmpR family regulator